MGKITKKTRDRGGDRRLEAKLEERSREIEELKRLLEPPLETTSETTINLIENQTHVRIYQVTSSLNHDISNLILDNICPIIQMQTRVIYSFSCSIYWGWNQLSQYRKTLSSNGTFTSLSQIEEYIRHFELQCLNLDMNGFGEKLTFLQQG